MKNKLTTEERKEVEKVLGRKLSADEGLKNWEKVVWS